MNKKNIFQFVRIYSLMLIGLFLIGSCAKERSAKTGEDEIITMKSIGYNKDGVEVSSFDFEWSLRVK